MDAVADGSAAEAAAADGAEAPDIEEGTQDLNPSARDPDLMNTSMDSATDDASDKQPEIRWSPDWMEKAQKNLQKTMDAIDKMDSEIAEKLAAAADMSLSVRDRGRASHAVKTLRKKLDKLTTKKAEHLSRIAELEVAKQKYDEVEAKKKTSKRAAELTALQQDKLLHLIYVTHALKFEGTTNKNEQVWISLTADFNAACQLEFQLPGEWMPEQLQRKWHAELSYYQELCRTLAGKSGDERQDAEKTAYKLRMWRPSFTYFEEHEVGSKAFTVPPLVLGGGQIQMTNAAKPVPLRIGGNSGGHKWRGVERAEADRKRNAEDLQLDADAAKYKRRNNKTLIAQQALQDHLAADKRQANLLAALKEHASEEVDAKKEMHAELMNAMKQMAPPKAPSASEAEMLDATLLNKITQLANMSTILASLDPHNVAYASYQNQIGVLQIQIEDLERQQQRRMAPLLAARSARSSHSVSSLRFDIPGSESP